MSEGMPVQRSRVNGASTSKWPNKGDSPVDRARQVTSEYRSALHALDPEACRAIDSAAIAAGETWVRPELAVESMDDLVTIGRAAELVGRSPRWVYSWTYANMDKVKDRNPMRVRIGDIVTALAYERSWRISREA